MLLFLKLCPQGTSWEWLRGQHGKHSRCQGPCVPAGHMVPVPGVPVCLRARGPTLLVQKAGKGRRRDVFKSQGREDG